MSYLPISTVDYAMTGT